MTVACFFLSQNASKHKKNRKGRDFGTSRFREFGDLGIWGFGEVVVVVVVVLVVVAVVVVVVVVVVFVVVVVVAVVVVVVAVEVVVVVGAIVACSLVGQWSRVLHGTHQQSCRSRGSHLNNGMANGEPSTTESRVRRILPPVQPKESIAVESTASVHVARRFCELPSVPLTDLLGFVASTDDMQDSGGAIEPVLYCYWCVESRNTSHELLPDTVGCLVA